MALSVQKSVKLTIEWPIWTNHSGKLLFNVTQFKVNLRKLYSIN